MNRTLACLQHRRGLPLPAAILDWKDQLLRVEVSGLAVVAAGGNLIRAAVRYLLSERCIAAFTRLTQVRSASLQAHGRLTRAAGDLPSSQRERWSRPYQGKLVSMRIQVNRGDHEEASVDLFPDTQPVVHGSLEMLEIDGIRERLALGEQQGALNDGRTWRVDPTWRDPIP